MVAQDFAPIPLLSALKHPLAAGGETVAGFRARVRQLELAALHGPRPAPGLAALRRALKRTQADPDLIAWLDRLAEIADPLVKLLRRKAVDLGEVVHRPHRFRRSLGRERSRERRRAPVGRRGGRERGHLRGGTDRGLSEFLQDPRPALSRPARRSHGRCRRSAPPRQPPEDRHPGAPGGPPPAGRRNDPGRPQRGHLAGRDRSRPLAQPAHAQRLRPGAARAADRPGGPTTSPKPSPRPKSC